MLVWKDQIFLVIRSVCLKIFVENLRWEEYTVWENELRKSVPSNSRQGSTIWICTIVSIYFPQLAQATVLHVCEAYHSNQRVAPRNLTEPANEPRAGYVFVDSLRPFTTTSYKGDEELRRQGGKGIIKSWRYFGEKTYQKVSERNHLRSGWVEDGLRDTSLGGLPFVVWSDPSPATWLVCREQRQDFSSWIMWCQPFLVMNLDKFI